MKAGMLLRKEKGGSEVTLHWKGPERGPTWCLRSIGV